jgi:hypothetical protein
MSYKSLKAVPIEVQLYGSREPYISLDELYSVIRIPCDTLADWSRRYPSFPCLRTPGSIRIRVSEVEAWLKQFNSEVVK